MRILFLGKRVGHCKRSALCTILLAVFMLNVMAQNSIDDMRKSAMETTLPVVVMPSPNSAVLTRNISENVDLYTGRLSVSIPVYTLKGKNIELPISLQATANAHRVDDVGSWTGMGWHLNAGGAITRVMKNLPDEFNGNISPSFNFYGVGFLNLNTQQENYVILDRFEPVLGPFAVPYSDAEMKSIINRGNWNTKTGRPDKGYDLQPDEFYFNFGNYSGKFVFNQGGSVLLTKGENLQITKTIINNKITGFTIITGDGYQYEFGNYALNAVEETKLAVSSKTLLYTYRHTGCAENGYITKPDGTSEFAPFYWYEASPYVMSTEPPAQWLADPKPYVPPGGMMDFWHGNNQYQAEYPTYPSTWYLTKVTAPTGDYINLSYVNNGTFNYVAGRSFSASEPQKGSLIYGQGCFDSPNPSDPWIFGGPYFKSQAPPKRLIIYDNYFYHYPSFGDYTISVNTITLNSKRLQEINTSNGYNVQFIANTSRPEFPGDRRLDKISVQYNGAILKEFLLGYETVENTEQVETITLGFKAPEYVYDIYSRNYWYTRPANGSRSETGVIDGSMRLRTYLKTITETGANGEALPPYRFDYYSPAELPFRTSSSQDKYGYAKIRGNTTQPVFDKLLAGVLRTVTYPTGGVKEFTFELSGNNVAWNGLRIATIKETESAGAVPIYKNYNYGPFQATDVAVTEYGMPDVVFGFPYNGGTYYTSVANKWMASYVSRVNPENETHGAAGGYSWVEESQPDNGKYRIEFYTSEQHSDIQPPTMLVSGFNGGFHTELGIAFPFPQKHSNDWKRGLPIAEYYKTASGNVRSVHYNYDFSTNAWAGGQSLGLQVSKYRIDYGFDWNWMLYGRYSFRPCWQLLTSKSVREYAADGQSYTESTVENTYDQLDYNSREWLFLRQVMLLSDGKNEQEVQRYRYPLDYNNTSDAFGQGIAQLKTKNVLTATIESYKYIQNLDGSNKRYVGGILNKYHSDKPLLRQSFSLQPSANLTSFTESASNGSSFMYDANYKPAMNFTRYDAVGNIEEQFKESDAKESYIWDYDNTYPVAKAINAGADEIAYTSFETSTTGNWILGSTYLYDDKAFTGKKSYYIGPGLTRNGLDPNKTYILSYWAQLPFNIVNVNGVQSSFTGPQINGWEYGEKRITGVSSITLTGFATIDEVRLHPAGAQMTTYLYDPKVGMILQNDPNNRITYYEYDGLQRLKLIKDAYGNIVKTFEYNYKTESTVPMWTNTAEKRCQPCSQNANYTTNIQQVKQVDVNPNSDYYKNERWADLGVTGACVAQQDWQTISGPTCLLNSSGYNTGIQRTVQQNMNPCSEGGGTTRNVDVTNYTACPSNEPNYQPTEELRCRPCSLNQAYTSKFQERKWVDINPNSTTHGSIDWRVTGVECPVSPDWQNTSTPPICVKNEMNLTNGYIKREKRAMNPCSDQYGITQWVEEWDLTACPWIQVSVIMDDYQWHGSYYTCDVTVKFYSDINMTQPVSVSNAVITIIEDYQTSCNWYTNERVFNNINGQSVKLYEDVKQEWEEGFCYWWVDFYSKYN